MPHGIALASVFGGGEVCLGEFCSIELCFVNGLDVIKTITLETERLNELNG